MYDIIIGRDLLDQVSGFVIPVLQRFCYMPRLQQGDFSMHDMPVIGGRTSTRSGHLHAATLADTWSFVPACSAVLQDAAPEPQANAAAAAAAHGVGAQRSAPPQPAAAEPSKGDTAAASRSRARRVWWAVSTTAASMLLLFLGPFLWFLESLTGAAAQPAPIKGVMFWRLGKAHRSAEGETIYLRTDGCSGGRKPKAVNILRTHLTFRYLSQAVPARLLLFLLLIAAVSITGTQAMQTYQSYSRMCDSTSQSTGARPYWWSRLGGCARASRWPSGMGNASTSTCTWTSTPQHVTSRCSASST